MFVPHVLTPSLAGVIGFFDPESLELPVPWTNSGGRTNFHEQSILIVGGGTNCGRFATQLASLVGFGKIVVVGGEEKELKSFGASHVINRHGEDSTVLQRIRDVVEDELLYAFDAYNAPDGQHLAINALSNSRKGKLARLVWSRGDVQEDKLHPKGAGYELKNVLGISHLKSDVARPFWKHASELLAQGKIKPLEYVTVQGLDVEKVNEVLDKYRDGKTVVHTHFRISE
jgi:NADPH2:quinone reductase